MQCKALFFFFLLPCLMEAQNLVPNGSFEDYISCPEHFDGMEFVEHWFKSILQPGVDYYQNPSPDYFHACALSPAVGVPDNLAGSQNPVDGNAYCGLVSYAANSQDYREILGVNLLNAVIPGQTYYCSLFYVRTVDLNGNAGLATNGIGLKFSTEVIFSSTEQALDGITHIVLDEIAVDSVNWGLLYGEFTPEQPYEYLHIGNFFTDDETGVTIFSQSSIWGYYFIDDVRVSTDPLVVNTGEELDSNSKLVVFPNPVSDVLNIVSQRKVQSVKIYSISGQLIEEFLSTTKGQLSLNIEHISQGLYIAVVYFDNGAVESVKINKN